MPLVSMKEMLHDAFQRKYAVGQFNVNSLEFIQAFIQAAQEEKSPIILGVTEPVIEYMGGLKPIASIVQLMMHEYEITVPVALHLDHCTSFDLCMKAMQAGFTSVMIDGSHLPLEKNIEVTARVLSAAAPLGVSVEAELGRISGQEDDMVIDESEGSIALPEDCQRFVSETGVTCLAPSLGSVHGTYKGEPNLRFDVLERVRMLTNIPLALHGGTGIPADDIRKAISLGISKINVNTENQILFAETVRKTLNEEPELHYLRTYMGTARDAVKESVKAKIREFGSFGKS